MYSLNKMKILTKLVNKLRINKERLSSESNLMGRLFTVFVLSLLLIGSFSASSEAMTAEEWLAENEALRAEPDLTEAELRLVAKEEKLALKEQRKEIAAKEKQEEKARKKALKEQKKAEKAHAKGEKKARYQRILFDSGYSYYMDTANTSWKKFPNKNTERIIDVWLRVVPEEGDKPSDNQSQTSVFPETYYLQHYYIRPDTHEIMFITELEVYGRPMNNLKEPAYDPGKWEKLIPGSLEDDIFTAVTGYMKKGKAREKSKDRDSLRDMVEEYFRVSL